MSEGEDAQKRYVVRETERYEMEREKMAFGLIAYGSEYVGRWLKHLGETTDALTEFPGPLSHARDEEASARYGREVRRLLSTARPAAVPGFPFVFCSPCCRPIPPTRRNPLKALSCC